MKISQLSKFAIALIITASAVTSKATSAASLMMLTYAATATEIYLQFDGRVGLRSSSTPTEAQAQKQIRKQMKYLQSSFRRARVAAIRSDWRTKVTGIESAGAGVYRIHYRFTATAVMHNSISNAVEVLLPVNPDTVETPLRVQLCEDQHQGNGAFYYYWNPRKPGCTMAQNSDYLSFTGVFTRKANTAQTYPEYNRLFNNGETRIVMMLGKVNPTDSDHPAQGQPWSFPVIQQSLRSMGFTSQMISSVPYIEEHRLQTPRGLVSVTVYFGETALNEPNSRTFHNLLKNSLENADVIMYGGHAGTGKNLNLEMIRSVSGLSIQPARNRYQILLLSACFPYAYYVKDFLSMKVSSSDPAGTKNLDVIADGVEGGFDLSGPQMSSTVRAIVDYANGSRITSYQQLLQSHAAFQNALMSVNGDEDNPTSPSSF